MTTTNEFPIADEARRVWAALLRRHSAAYWERRRQRGVRQASEGRSVPWTELRKKL